MAVYSRELESSVHYAKKSVESEGSTPEGKNLLGLLQQAAYLTGDEKLDSPSSTSAQAQYTCTFAMSFT